MCARFVPGGSRSNGGGRAGPAGDYRTGIKGTIASSVNQIGRRRLFGRMLHSALAGIARTSADDGRTA
jgi:hypothetical protein